MCHCRHRLTGELAAVVGVAVVADLVQVGAQRAVERDRRVEHAADRVHVHVRLERGDLQRGGARQVADERHVDQIGHHPRALVLAAVAGVGRDRVGARAGVVAADRRVGARVGAAAGTAPPASGGSCAMRVSRSRISSKWRSSRMRSAAPTMPSTRCALLRDQVEHAAARALARSRARPACRAVVRHEAAEHDRNAVCGLSCASIGSPAPRYEMRWRPEKL